MNLIKVGATNSTNTLISDLFRGGKIEYWTALYAVDQIEGRGQFSRIWESDPGKNLTISFLIPELFLSHTHEFSLISSFALLVAQWLEELGVHALTIKWPNDILSGHNKLAGILTQRVYQGAQSKGIILGLGLNVNQMEFPRHRGVSSLAKLMGNEFSIDELAVSFSQKVEAWGHSISCLSELEIHKKYLNYLYKYKEQSEWEVVDPLEGTSRIKAWFYELSGDGQVTLQYPDHTIKTYSHDSLRMIREGL